MCLLSAIERDQENVGDDNRPVKASTLEATKTAASDLQGGSAPVRASSLRLISPNILPAAAAAAAVAGSPFAGSPPVSGMSPVRDGVPEARMAGSPRSLINDKIRGSLNHLTASLDHLQVGTGPAVGGIGGIGGIGGTAAASGDMDLAARLQRLRSMQSLLDKK